MAAIRTTIEQVPRQDLLGFATLNPAQPTAAGPGHDQLSPD